MKNLSLRIKLFLLCGVISCVGLIVGGVSYWAIQTMKRDYMQVSKVNLPNIVSMYDMFTAFRQARVEALHLTKSEITPEKAQQALEALKKSLEDDAIADKAYNEVPFLPGEEVIYKKMRESIKHARDDIDRIVDSYMKNPTAGGTEHKERSIIALYALSDHANDTIGAMKDLRDFHLNSAKETAAKAEDTAQKGTLYNIVVLVVGLFCGFGFGYVFSNQLVATLKHIGDALSAASNEVSAAAVQISSSSIELSEASAEQAASLQETAASVNEISSMVDKNTANARAAVSSTTTSQQQATQGQQSVENVISSMQEIEGANEQVMDQVARGNAQLLEIVSMIHGISDKTKVINEIVFQTKLLSFNASVEAARAGEHGKGFSVVAEEVGSLAQMSGNAAKEISDLLQSSVKKVEGIVQESKTTIESLMHASKEKIATGTQVTHKCRDTLQAIGETANQVARMANEISAAGEEQSRGVQEISQAMNQLDQVTQQNALASRETSTAAESLATQSTKLNNLVVDLAIAINGVRVANDYQKKVTPKAKPQTKTPTAKKSNVVPLPVAQQPQPPVHRTAAKQVSGDSISVPSADDSRFEDI